MTTTDTFLSLTPKRRKVLGLAALNEIHPHFMNDRQAMAVRDLIKTSEEGDFYSEAMIKLAKRIREMPTTGQQEGLGTEAIAYLRYFGGPGTWWITEKDIGCPTDESPGAQHQAFGFSAVHDEAELGYISLPELFKVRTRGFPITIDLDFHFEPCVIRLIKASIRQ